MEDGKERAILLQQEPLHRAVSEG